MSLLVQYENQRHVIDEQVNIFNGKMLISGLTIDELNAIDSKVKDAAQVLTQMKANIEYQIKAHAQQNWLCRNKKLLIIGGLTVLTVTAQIVALVYASKSTEDKAVTVPPNTVGILGTGIGGYLGFKFGTEQSTATLLDSVSAAKEQSKKLADFLETFKEIKVREATRMQLLKEFQSLARQPSVILSSTQPRAIGVIQDSKEVVPSPPVLTRVPSVVISLTSPQVIQVVQDRKEAAVPPLTLTRLPSVEKPSTPPQATRVAQSSQETIAPPLASPVPRASKTPSLSEMTRSDSVPGLARLDSIVVHPTITTEEAEPPPKPTEGSGETRHVRFEQDEGSATPSFSRSGDQIRFELTPRSLEDDEFIFEKCLHHYEMLPDGFKNDNTRARIISKRINSLPPDDPLVRELADLKMSTESSKPHASDAPPVAVSFATPRAESVKSTVWKGERGYALPTPHNNFNERWVEYAKKIQRRFRIYNDITIPNLDTLDGSVITQNGSLFPKTPQ